MAENLGLMMIAVGAALIGAIVLTQKEEDPQEKLDKETKSSTERNNREPRDPTETYQPKTSVAGTVLSINGKEVIPVQPLAWIVELYDCQEVRWNDSGHPMCKQAGDWISIPLPTEEQDSSFFGIKKALGFGRGDEVPPRVNEGARHQLYVFSGDPVIESIGTTRGRPLGVGGKLKKSFMDTGASEQAYYSGLPEG